MGGGLHYFIDMKHLYLIIYILFVSPVLRAQIPNDSFESWNGNTPTGWTTNNSGSTVTVTKVSDAREGSFALKGTVVAGPTTVAVPPVVQSVSGNYGFPADASFTHFSCWYKTFLLMSDRFNVNIFIYDASFAVVGGGSVSLNNSESAYTPLTVPVFHFAPGAAWAMISFTIVDGTTQTPGHVMSWFQVDDLSSQAGSTGFGTSSESERHWSITPFTNLHQLRIQAPETGNYEFSLLDLTGRVVYNSVLEVTAPGEHFVRVDKHNFTPGVYIATLSDKRQRYAVTRLVMQ